MRSRYHVGNQHQAHFITSTVVEWLPVFTTATCCDILVHTLRYCQEHKMSTDEMMGQKIDYIRHNPVARGLVSLPEHRRHSSAHEWLAGGQPVLRCDLWR